MEVTFNIVFVPNFQIFLVAVLVTPQMVQGYTVVDRETEVGPVSNDDRESVPHDESDAELVGQRRQLADLSAIVSFYFLIYTVYTQQKSVIILTE